jgi:peptidoglycan/xylan/chitin deacetylase (PgdA/CDA1 family)
MNYEVERDFVGYGGHPPDPYWPNDARLAVNFVMNNEEGSEPSFSDGDGVSEHGLTEVTSSSTRPGERNLAAESMFEYGSRIGFWRVLRLFRERGLPLTVFGCALALERNPAVVAAIREAGFDICCHGYRWVRHFEMAEAQEREQIGKAVTTLTRLFGEHPPGWYCRYGPSVNTRRLLAEEGGFLYDSDAYNDELPYWLNVDGRAHLVVPYSLVNNDGKFANGAFATAGDYEAFHRDAFDMLLREGETSPKMMSVGLHLRQIGHPARAAGLERFLDHVQVHKDAWVCRREDIARHWMAVHPHT